MDTYNFDSIVPKFDKILARGLCSGLGKPDDQMCIEAAICSALGLPHGDDPTCVTSSVRAFKIALNDSNWSSPRARAAGLRDLGIAQIGSKGIVDPLEFSKRIVERTIRVLIPKLFREIFPNDKELLTVILRCEQEGSTAAADAAATAARCALCDAAAARCAAAHCAAATAARCAAATAADAAAAARYAAAAARYAADTAQLYNNPSDNYLLLSASLALEVLRELNSPGVKWLDAQK